MIAESKKVLTFDEAAEYTGLSKSYLYKMTSQRVVPHYKPNGKLIFFEREELEKWLLSTRVTPQQEINEAAQTYVTTGKHGRV